MKTSKWKESLWMTLKLQPIVVLYSFVSIGSKLASNQIPKWDSNLWNFILDCITNWKLVLILGLMFIILLVYAVIWQKCIKNVPITVMYANKSSYIFWTQLAAVVIFMEKLNWCNVLGIVIIFAGIMVVNSDER